MPRFITGWLLWDQESFLLTLWVSSNRNLTSVWYYYSIRRLNLHSPGFFVGSNTFHFSDKCPLSQQCFDRVGGTPAEELTNGFHDKLKYPQEVDRISAWISRWKGNPQTARDLWQKTKRFLLPKKLNLHVTLQTCVRDCSSSYSQVASKVEAGYNKAACSWPSEQFLLPFVTEVRAPTGLNSIISVEIWDQMNLFHMSLPNSG